MSDRDPVEELREANEARTGGEWFYLWFRDGDSGCIPEGWSADLDDGSMPPRGLWRWGPKPDPLPFSRRDVQFIATCSRAVPALLARLEAAEAVCEAIRAAAQHDRDCEEEGEGSCCYDTWRLVHLLAGATLEPDEHDGQLLARWRETWKPRGTMGDYTVWLASTWLGPGGSVFHSIDRERCKDWMHTACGLQTWDCTRSVPMGTMIDPRLLSLTTTRRCKRCWPHEEGNDAARGPRP